jgi:hypothetical protein
VIELRIHAAVLLNLPDRGRGHAVTCNRLIRLTARLRGLNLTSQSYVGKRAISKRDRGSYTEVCGGCPFAALCSGIVAAIIRANRRTAGIGVTRPLKLERIADFLPKCSNTARRSLDASGMTRN